MDAALSQELPQLFRLFDSIKSELPWPELEHIFTAAMDLIGFKEFVFTVYTEDFSQSQETAYHTHSKTLEAWFEHFWKTDYDAHDPIGQKVRTSNFPVLWDLTELAEQYTGKTRRLFLDAIAFGLQAGFSQALYAANGQFAILVGYFQKKDNPEDLHVKHRIYLATLIGKLYLDVVNEKLLKSTKPVNLTKRELQVLQLMAQSLTTKVLAEQLHISERTANFHIENIKFKFNVNGKQQAIIKAASLGLIRL